MHESGFGDAEYVNIFRSTNVPNSWSLSCFGYVPIQGRQFVFKSAGDNNHNFECGLKSAGYNYVFISLTFHYNKHCITVY